MAYFWLKLVCTENNCLRQKCDDANKCANLNGLK